MVWDFITNCYGFEFTILTTALEKVGFSSSAEIVVDTPKGDFKLLITTGAFS